MKEEIVHPNIDFLTEMDTTFGDVVALYGHPVSVYRPATFESLVKIILEQQVSLASAHACYLKLMLHLGSLDAVTIP